MHQIANVAKRLGKTVSDNSPAILTATAVAGVVTTAFLTGKASIKAAEELRYQELQNETSYKGFPKEQFQFVWKLYIPAVLSGASTIACIVAANQIGSRRNAALLSAYSLTDTAFREYKEKVFEQLGAGKEQKVRDEIAQDRVTKDPPKPEIMIVGKGDVLCMELMSGRYFKSNMEAIRKAQNDLNQMVLNDMYASHNDFLNLIGLESNGYGEEVGWNIDNLIDVQFSAVLTPEGEPCIAIGYAKFPRVNFHKIG
jgi:hypothetical protein